MNREISHGALNAKKLNPLFMLSCSNHATAVDDAADDIMPIDRAIRPLHTSLEPRSLTMGKCLGEMVRGPLEESPRGLPDECRRTRLVKVERGLCDSRSEQIYPKANLESDYTCQ